MRDPARIDRVLEHLRNLWKMRSDQRLGQLLVNVCGSENMIWHVEDDGWEKALEDLSKKCPRCGGTVQRTTLTPPEGGEAVGCDSCTWPNPDPSWSTK